MSAPAHRRVPAKGFRQQNSVVHASVVVGGHQTPPLFDASDLEGINGVMRLEILQSKPVGDDCVWIHYRAKND